MDFARQQRNPTRHLVGFGVVVLLHVVVVYALLTGLARRVVEVVKGPLEVKVIEEEIKKPPPPPELLPPPPKLAAPPPPFIPPPEVNIAPPPQVPVITAVTQEPPPAPQAPVIAKIEPTPAPAPPPAIRNAKVACSNYAELIQSVAYPREAALNHIEGEVEVEFILTADGQIKDPVITKPADRIFTRPSLSLVRQLKCPGQGRDTRLALTIKYKLGD